MVKAKPKLGGRAVPTPPVLFMTPAGKVLGEVSNYASPDQVLATMRKVLKDHPQFNRMTPEEKNEPSPLKRAELLIDLQRYDDAKKALANETSDAAQYLLGRLARFRKDWPAMTKHFALVKDKKLQADVRMESAYRFWHANEFQKLAAHLKGFPKASTRYAEARYFEGLAAFHQGDKKNARSIWEQTIKSRKAEGRWIYRADWAFCASKQGKRRFFSSRGPTDSLLERIGYMSFRGNPDLKPRG